MSWPGRDYDNQVYRIRDVKTRDHRGRRRGAPGSGLSRLSFGADRELRHRRDPRQFVRRRGGAFAYQDQGVPRRADRQCGDRRHRLRQVRPAPLGRGHLHRERQCAPQGQFRRARLAGSGMAGHPELLHPRPDGKRRDPAQSRRHPRPYARRRRDLQQRRRELAGPLRRRRHRRGIPARRRPRAVPPDRAQHRPQRQPDQDARRVRRRNAARCCGPTT